MAGVDREKALISVIVSLKATVYWLNVHNQFRNQLETWKYLVKSKILIEYRSSQLKSCLNLFLVLFEIENGELSWKI